MKPFKFAVLLLLALLFLAYATASIIFAPILIIGGILFPPLAVGWLLLGTAILIALIICIAFL